MQLLYRTGPVAEHVLTVVVEHEHVHVHGPCLVTQPLMITPSDIRHACPATHQHEHHGDCLGAQTTHCILSCLAYIDSGPKLLRNMHVHLV